jgi:foldase protein PrsA
MKKAILLAGVFSLVLAACASADEVVSTVNGVEISRSSVESLVRDPGSGFSDQDFATYLSVVIQWEAADQAATEQYGVDVAEEQIDERVDQLVADSAPGATLEEYLVSVNATEDGMRSFAESLLVQETVQAEVASTLDPGTDEDIVDEIAAFPLDWTQVCASHILVATEGEAADIKAQLDGGADFSALATEFSIDPESAAQGGDLGCASPAVYAEPFAEATMSADIGVVTDPVETDFGYHLVLVTDRVDAPADGVRAYLEQTRAQDALNAWFADMSESTDITVAEDVGEWVTDPTPQVLVSN